jgi:hypothetical protein
VHASINKVAAHNCWVCEHYVEVMFELTLPDSFDGLNIESVFLHLEFENYEPSVMRKKDLPPIPRMKKPQKQQMMLEKPNLPVNQKRL